MSALIDNLVNGGKLPTIDVNIETQSIINIGFMIVIVASIIIVLNAIFKEVSK